MLVGTKNYKKDLYIDAGSHSCKTQPFYSPEFEDAARAIIQTDMSQTRTLLLKIGYCNSTFRGTQTYV